MMMAITDAKIIAREVVSHHALEIAIIAAFSKTDKKHKDYADCYVWLFA